jgi:diadenosine tetraphosphate (Ap4A) HIT family hydrolase
MAEWALNQRLAADSFRLGGLALSDVLVMRTASYPWLILVPRIPGVREIIDLAPLMRQQLMDEISLVSEVMQSVYQPDKLNVAALGNQVSQLHVHVIARFKTDADWPNPVWGGELLPLSQAAQEECALVLARAFSKISQQWENDKIWRRDTFAE